MTHSNTKLKPQSRLWSITTYAAHARACKGSRKYWEEAGIGLPEYMLDTAHSSSPLCAYWSPHNNPGKWVSLFPEQKSKTKATLGKWAISKLKRQWIPILPQSSEEGVLSYRHQHPEVQVGLQFTPPCGVIPQPSLTSPTCMFNAQPKHLKLSRQLL